MNRRVSRRRHRPITPGGIVAQNMLSQGRVRYPSRRRIRFGVGLGISLWLLFVLVWLSIVGGIIFVAVHFITKYW